MRYLAAGILSLGLAASEWLCGSPVLADSMGSTGPARTDSVPWSVGLGKPMPKGGSVLGKPTPVVRAQSSEGNPLLPPSDARPVTVVAASAPTTDGTPSVSTASSGGDGRDLFLDCGPVMYVRGPTGNLYGTVEFLLWHLRDSKLPPLITTSSVLTRNVPFIPGAIGSPGTVELFGGDINHGWTPGVRGTLGYWFDPCQTLGIEGGVFGLEHRGVTYVAGSEGNPPLFRPFFNQSPTLVPPFVGEDVQDVAFPSELSGVVIANLDSRLWGAELNLRKSLCYGMTRHCTCYSVDLLGGFRYLSLDETLQIDEDLVTRRVDNLGPPPGTRFVLHDEFRTDNRFYGGQLGAVAEFRRGVWFLNVRGLVALGGTRQEVRIDGATVATAPNGQTLVRRGGLLTQPTNIGHYERTVFSVVPEVGINVGCQVTEGLRIFAGYSFLYWSNVARPGEAVDRVVNVTQLPGSPVPFSGPARPAFVWSDTDLWVHGLNAGLELRY